MGASANGNIDGEGRRIIYGYMNEEESGDAKRVKRETRSGVRECGVHYEGSWKPGNVDRLVLVSLEDRHESRDADSLVERHRPLGVPRRALGRRSDIPDLHECYIQVNRPT